LLARRLGCCIQIEREALIRSRRLPQRSGVSPFPEEPRTSAELILMGGRSAQWWGAMGLCPAQRERALDIRDGLRRAHSSPSCWRVHRKGASWSIVLHHRRPSMCTAHRPSGEVRFWSFECERGWVTLMILLYFTDPSGVPGVSHRRLRFVRPVVAALSCPSVPTNTSTPGVSHRNAEVCSALSCPSVPTSTSIGVHVGDSHLTDSTAVATDTAYLY